MRSCKSLYKLHRTLHSSIGNKGCKSPDTPQPLCPLVGLAAGRPEALSVHSLQTMTANSVSSIVSKAEVIHVFPGICNSALSTLICFGSYIFPSLDSCLLCLYTHTVTRYKLLLRRAYGTAINGLLESTLCDIAYSFCHAGLATSVARSTRIVLIKLHQECLSGTTLGFRQGCRTLQQLLLKWRSGQQ